MNLFLFLDVLGFRCCTQAFLVAVIGDYFLAVVLGFLIANASGARALGARLW